MYFQNYSSIKILSIMIFGKLTLSFRVLEYVCVVSSYLRQNLLKVSKSRKQIVSSSHTPKNQQKCSHSFALASKKPLKVVETKYKNMKILI